jgi:hypothetical protein
MVSTVMKYSNNMIVEIGDTVKIGLDVGLVICDIDRDECVDDFEMGDWKYLKRGILVEFQNSGIVHMESPEFGLEFVKRKTRS